MEKYTYENGNPLLQYPKFKLDETIQVKKVSVIDSKDDIKELSNIDEVSPNIWAQK